MTMVTRYLYRAPFVLDALALDVPVLAEEHPNKAPFRGILTRIDEPSTRAPNGSQGHRVLIPRAVAEQALPSLVGMPIDCSLNLKDHDKKNVVGVIEGGHIEGKDLVVAGYLLEKNYPQEVAEIRSKRSQLGMSYEIADVTVADTDASIWTLTGLTFTGAAILRKDAAAYANTAIAAQTQEDRFMPGEATAIVDELKKIGRQLDAARKDEDEDEDDAAARKEEEDAKRSDEAARKAREEEDEDDAKRHDAEASRLRLSAATRHEAAAALRRLAAAKATDEDEDDTAKKREEEAAARHTAEAKRLREEDAAATARRRAEEDEEDEEAAAKHEEDEDDAAMMPALFSMLLKGMGYRRKADAAAARGRGKANGRPGHMQDDDDDDMAAMMGRMLLKAMGTRSSRAAAHDDEAEDTALFKRLMRLNERGDVKASARHGTVTDLETRRLRRQLRSLEAAMGLITDTLKQQSGLITDLVQKTKTLATDGYRPGQGGPVRRTLAATGGEHFVGPFDHVEAGGETMTMDALNAALDKAGMQVGVQNNRMRMAKKLEAMEAGLIKTE